MHPLARAIVQYANTLEGCTQDTTSISGVKNFESITGQGVHANIENKKVLIGNRRLMEGHNISLSAEVSQHLQHMEDLAQTAVLVSIEHEVVGIIAVSDPVKPEAIGAISILQSWGIKSIMVTGDNWGTAQAVAREVGIEIVFAEAEPSTKVDKIKDLQVISCAFNCAMLAKGFEICRVSLKIYWVAEVHIVLFVMLTFPVKFQL